MRTREITPSHRLRTSIRGPGGACRLLLGFVLASLLFPAWGAAQQPTQTLTLEEATRRGHTAIYGGTKNLGRFLKSLGWEFQEMIGLERESLALFRWRPPKAPA